MQPSYDKEGKRIVFVRNRLTNFQLCVAPVPEGPEPARTGSSWTRTRSRSSTPPTAPWKAASATTSTRPASRPTASPSSSPSTTARPATSASSATTARATGPCWPGAHDERDPEWSPDGKSFYFSSDSTGIYNIYRCDLGDRRRGALTQVAGGAFAPAVDPSGKRLAYAGYDKDGFSLYLPRHRPPGAAGLGRGPGARIREAETDRAHRLRGQERRSTSGVPNRYLLNPILFGEEMSSVDRRAPASGETRWLAGFNAILNDPVLKNELFGALLLEVGNGLDYFGAHDEILSADKESQLYLACANHSLPVSLGASFARGNLRTEDTVTVGTRTSRPARRREPELRRHLPQRGGARLAYDLFDADAVGEDEKTSYARLAAGYSWNDFNFYEIPFGFEYYNNRYLSAQLDLLRRHLFGQGPGGAPGPGRRGRLHLQPERPRPPGQLPGDLHLRGRRSSRPTCASTTSTTWTWAPPTATGLPWAKNGSVLVSGFAGSILDWHFTNRERRAADTLDSFFSKGLFLRGYPYLRDIENLAFQGENVVKLSADVNQPLVPDIYRGFWILFIEDLYANVFWEAGPRLERPLCGPRPLRRRRLEARRQCRRRLVPERGLGPQAQRRDLQQLSLPGLLRGRHRPLRRPRRQGRHRALEEIRIPFGRESSLNTFATRISFGVSFGLYNGLLGTGPRASGPTARVRTPSQPPRSRPLRAS